MFVVEVHVILYITYSICKSALYATHLLQSCLCDVHDCVIFKQILSLFNESLHVPINAALASKDHVLSELLHGYVHLHVHHVFVHRIV